MNTVLRNGTQAVPYSFDPTAQKDVPPQPKSSEPKGCRHYLRTEERIGPGPCPALPGGYFFCADGCICNRALIQYTCRSMAEQKEVLS